MKKQSKIYTRYEEARLIGARALQLSMGGIPLVKIKSKDYDPIKLAEEEFKKGKLPLEVID